MSDEPTGAAGVLAAIRRRWRVALLMALPLWLGIVVYAEHLPSRYDGVVKVAFTPQAGKDIGADTIRLVAPQYVAYLTAPATSRMVSASLGVSPGALEAVTTAQLAPETNVLTLTVRLRDPGQAAQAANAFAAAAVSFSEADRLLDATVVSPALPPGAPASPPRRLLEAAGLLVALVAGGSLALVVDRSRPRITTPLSLALASGHPVVGRVPASRVLRGAVPESLADPAVGTAVRAMRIQLEQQSRTSPFKVLAVTSPTSGDGKTTVACALAAALARVDTAVLLIDADMRRPAVAEALGIPSAHVGLAQVLDGDLSLTDVVQPVGRGLSAVTTRPRDDAGDLITRRLAGVLEQARHSYDVVVVDCPPILATDDARTLALMCDATVLVVGIGSDTARVAEAAANLDSLGVRVLGTVLNRSRAGRREGMGSYGGYSLARR